MREEPREEGEEGHGREDEMTDGRQGGQETASRRWTTGRGERVGGGRDSQQGQGAPRREEPEHRVQHFTALLFTTHSTST